LSVGDTGCPTPWIQYESQPDLFLAVSNHSRDLPNSRLIVRDLGPSSLGFASWDDVAKAGRHRNFVMGLIFTLDQYPERYNYLTIFSPWWLVENQIGTDSCIISVSKTNQAVLSKPRKST